MTNEINKESADTPARSLPIGIFDSGLGGLSALKEVAQLLPKEKLIYFGDTSRVPYGTRSRETIIRYAQQDVRFLLSLQIKCIVIACGTVSSAALDMLKQTFDLPIIGVIEPAVQRAAETTKNGKVAVIATPSTIASNAYARHLHGLNESLQVIQQACPLFVPLVENGFCDPDDPVPFMVAQRYLKPVAESGADTLILGCTHYPLLKAVIHRVLPGVKLIDTGVEVAYRLQSLLQEQALQAPASQNGDATFFVSDTPESFEKQAGIFLGNALSHPVKKIAIETY